MKKVFIGLFLAVFSLLVLNVTKASSPSDNLPANCIAYSDGCNSCGRSEGGEWMCTMMACTEGQTHAPVCTAYTGEKQPVACTMEYAPVCGSYKPHVECIQAPCPVADPVAQTYSNKCMMNADGATYLYDGECNATPPPPLCTTEYNPVCGSVQVDCIRAPCPPIPETFSNICELKASPRATFLYGGVCKGNLQAGEGYAYNSIASVLDQSYLARHFTPIQASNYTQTIIDKIDHTLEVSRLQKRAYDKYVQLKKFLQLYITLGTK